MNEKAPLLRVYNWEIDEFLLVDWYNNLIMSGDHFKTFYRDLRHLSTFLDFFKPPRTLAIAVDDKGIWFAYWIDSMMSGAFFGLWVREDKRQAPSMLKCFREAINGSFLFASVLISITKQDHVCRQLEKLGFDYLGRVPALWDGENVDVYTLTKDDWEQRYGSTHRKE